MVWQDWEVMRKPDVKNQPRFENLVSSQALKPGRPHMQKKSLRKKCIQRVCNFFDGEISALARAQELTQKPVSSTSNSLFAREIIEAGSDHHASKYNCIAWPHP